MDGWPVQKYGHQNTYQERTGDINEKCSCGKSAWVNLAYQRSNKKADHCANASAEHYGKVFAHRSTAVELL